VGREVCWHRQRGARLKKFKNLCARYLNSPNFSPNVAEIPNLGTNSPKVGSLILKQNKRKARKSVGEMRNNLDGDVTKSYRMRTQFMFDGVLCWLALGNIS